MQRKYDVQSHEYGPMTAVWQDEGWVVNLPDGQNAIRLVFIRSLFSYSMTADISPSFDPILGLLILLSILDMSSRSSSD